MRMECEKGTRVLRLPFRTLSQTTTWPTLVLAHDKRLGLVIHRRRTFTLALSSKAVLLGF
jgi:hypothetical protein